GENYTRTLLIEGSVQFADLQENETVILTPGQEAKLVKGEKNIQVKNVKNMDRALAWHSHNFSFDNETLESILAVLSDAYDKKLQIKEKSIGSTRYTLKFNKGESLPKMLEVLSEVADFKHSIKNDLIIIEKK
ncbi:MAG: FecR family protein, partial [Paludibacter sp.]